MQNQKSSFFVFFENKINFRPDHSFETSTSSSYTIFNGLKYLFMLQEQARDLFPFNQNMKKKIYWVYTNDKSGDMRCQLGQG